jgi:hypothetical protein
LCRIAEPGVYSFVAFLKETEEYAATVSWAHALGKPGVERLRKRLQDWDPLIDEVLKILAEIDSYTLETTP